MAENSGGVHCSKYGLTVHNILKLKLVGVEGELFEVGAEAGFTRARPASDPGHGEWLRRDGQGLRISSA